jgi:hypothetical protein
MKKEVYLFNYTGEGHALSRLANQQDWSQRMEQFFDYYLRESPRPDWMEGRVDDPNLGLGYDTAKEKKTRPALILRSQTNEINA